MDAADPDDDALDPGGRIGRYRCLGVLGRGAHGTVYEAEMSGPDGFRKRVALKVLDVGEHADREARIGGLLSHPNLVDVYEVTTIDGRGCCAMELCSGGTLLDATDLSPRAIVDVGLQVCAALGYAHEAMGLVHRDLKPANLFLEGGLVKVGDLGIARAEGFDDDGRIRGTPAYMAPEQLRGDPVDARADVYALGVVLTELAGGASAWDADTVPVSDARAATTPEVTATSEVAGWLEPALARALEPDPANRYASMAEFAEALATVPAEGVGLAEGMPAHSRAPGPLIGRSALMQTVQSALLQPGLVVLHGPAGIGKTRLARACIDEHAVFVQLAACRSVHEVLGAMAAALDLQLEDRNPVEQLCAALRHRSRHRSRHRAAVVVLDTLEHLESAELDAMLTALLDGAPELRVLATSRSRPGVSHRWVAVGPLTTEESLALLLSRARARGQILDPGPTTRSIVEQLDGVPFAIELAAARIGVLDPAEVLQRLELSWLRSRERADGTTRTAHQSTLEATLQWSWELLDPATRRGLAELSVLEGPFTTDAVAALTSGVLPVSTLLQIAWDQSWLGAEGERARWYRLTRAFVRERADPEVLDAARTRHRAWFAARGTPEAILALSSFGGLDRWRALCLERDDLVAAAESGIEEGALEESLRAVEALLEVIERIGPPERADPLLAGLEEVVVRSEHRARLGLLRARLAVRRSNRALALVERARPLLDPEGWYGVRALYREASQRVRRGLPGADVMLRDVADRAKRNGWPHTEAAAVVALGQLADRNGEDALAGAHYARGLKLAREVGDVWQLAIVHGNLAKRHHGFGRIHQALANLLTSAAMHYATGNRRSQGVALTNLAAIVDHRDARLSRAFARRALEIHRQVGNRRFEALTLANLGALAILERDWTAARRELDAAITVYDGLTPDRLSWQARCGDAYVEAMVGDVHAARDRLKAMAAGREHYPLEAYRWYVATALCDARIGDVGAANARLDEARDTLRAHGVSESAFAWTVVDTFWETHDF